MIMLIELTQVLSQELKFLCIKTTTALMEWTIPKTMDVSYIFTALEINIYIVQKCMYAVIYISIQYT